MYFVAMGLHLTPQSEEGTLGHSDAVYLQAAVYRLISHQNEAAGRTLHDAQRNKPYTVAVLPPGLNNPQVRLTWLGAHGLHYAEMFTTAIARQPVLRIGPTTWEVNSVNVDSSDWSGSSTWSDLCGVDSTRDMRFAFVTPTAIMKRDANGKRFTSLFPDPIDLFSGLHRRWRALAGPPLPDDLLEFVQSGGCVVANHRLHTIDLELARHMQIGFVGQVVYHCRKPSIPHILALNALARLAFFSGVGCQTTRGMGAVQIRVES